MPKIKTMNKLIKKLVAGCIYASTSALILSSCTKNAYDKVVPFEMDPSFNVGLISGKVGFSNLNNILSDNNSYLKIGSDSAMTFYWKGNLSTFHTVDFIPAFVSDPVLFSLDAVNKSILQNGTVNAPITITESQPIDIKPLKASRIDIDSILLKSGEVEIIVNNKFNEPCTMVVSIPGIKQFDGKPLSTTFNIKANATTTGKFDISNKWVDMSRGGTTTNNLLINYSITLLKAKTGVEPNGDLTFSQKINHPELKMLYGDVHQQNFFNAYVSDIPLKAFQIQQLVGNTIKFTNDSINLLFSNSFGVPMSFKFKEIKGIDANNKNHYLNVDGINPTPFTVPGARNLKETTHATMSLNNNNPMANGNLLDISGFLGTLPATIAPQFTVISNPGPQPRNKNFISDTSTGKIDAEIIIPLSLTVNNFITKDTFDFSFGDIANVDSFTLRFALNNGIPLGLSAALDFVDANYKVLYHINNTTFVRPAAVDNANKVIGKTLTITDIEIGKKVVPILKNVYKMVFTGTLVSPSKGVQPAVLYSNQTLDINIGAKAHLKLN